jgi:DNA polymerase III epsilon subunit-like protein
MIIIDAEASGVWPEKNGLLSLGAIDLANPENRFYAECRLWDGAEIDPISIGICGFSEEQARDINKITDKELLEKFIEWWAPIEDKNLAGHNTGFDRDYLASIAARYNITDWPIIRRTLDLHTLCYTIFIQRGLPIPTKDGQSSLNSDMIFKFVGLPKETRPHNALTGALMEAEAFNRLLYKKNLLPEFKDFPLPENW